MSFPRAKILRFNESITCSPAVGTYNPILDATVKTPTMRKSVRQTSEGDLNNIVSKHLPASAIPVFRTPQLPRKALKNGGKCQSRERTQSSSSYEDVLVEKDGLLYQDLNEMENLRERLKCTIEDLSRSKEKCEVLNSNIEVKTIEIQRLREENELLAREIETLQKELEAAYYNHHQSLTKFEALDHDTLSQFGEIRLMVNALSSKKDEGCKEMLKLREELDCLASMKCELEQKVTQKQQMILLLQSELSNAEVELVECKSECDRQSAAVLERTSEIQNLKETILNFENKMEQTDKQLRLLRDNLMNGSVCREALEEQLTEKDGAYKDLLIRYNELLSQCEHLKEAHTKEIDQIVENCGKHLSKMLHDIGESSELVHYETSFIQFTCCEKLNEFVKKWCLSFEEMKDVWQRKTMLIKSELENAADKLKEEQLVAHEKIECLINEAQRKDSESSQRIKEVESEARIITEKLLRAEEELKNLHDLTEELKISAMENKITIVELQDKVDTLTVERDALQSKQLEIVKECNVLKSQNKKLTVGNRNLGESLDALSTRLLESELDVEKLTDLRDELESERNNLQTQLKEKMLELEEQKTNIAKIEAENLQQIEKVREDLLEKLNSFKRKALSSSEQLQEFESGKNREIKILSVQLEHFQEELSELANYVDEMEQENQKQVNQLNVFQEQQKNLEKSFTSLSAKYEQQTMELNQRCIELTDAQNKILSYEEHIVEYKSDIEKLTGNIGNLEAKIMELNEALGVMEETNSEHEREIEALTEKLDHQRDCAKIATQQIANLEATKSYQEHQIQSLNSELERHKEFSHQATEHMLTLTNSNTEKEKKIEIITEEFEELKGNYKFIAEELQEWKIKQLSGQKQLQESFEEIKLLEGDRFVKEEQIKELSAEVEKLKEYLNNYSLQIIDLEIKKKEFEEKLKISELKVNELERMSITTEDKYKIIVTNLEESAKGTAVENENIREELGSTKNQINDLLRVKSELELEIHEINRKCNTFQNSFSKERDLNSELKSRIAHVEDTLREKETLCISLHETIERGNNQIGNLLAEIAQLKQDQERDNNAVTVLKKKIEELQKENERLLCCEETSNEWEKKYLEVESLIGPFRKQLEIYSAECKMLKSEKGEVEKNMRDLELKYASTLGHQNHKQKIRYFVKLKDENLELKQEVRSLRRTVDKLRLQGPTVRCKSPVNATSLVNKGKENIQSVSHTPLATKGKENIQTSNRAHIPISSTISSCTKSFADRPTHKKLFDSNGKLV